MNYYVTKNVAASGDGSKSNPFGTINEAAQIMQPGDAAIISGGIYRENVMPIYGGTDENNRITYKAAEDENVIISGSEVVEKWEKAENGIWRTQICNDIFTESNPFATEIAGDWFDGFSRKHHTAGIYLDGESLMERESVDSLREAEGWFAVVSDYETSLYCNFGTENPNEHKVEMNVRPACFFPRETGINYITVSGLVLENAATQWAPPTAFQSGIIGTNWSKGWIIENCTIRNSRCCGISIGKRKEKSDNSWSCGGKKDGTQAYIEIICRNVADGWSKETVGSHIIRNNVIHDCGQTGIVGNMGCAFSKIYQNHIYNINISGEFGGAEMAGIKLHSAIDTLISDNCIHDCIMGIWLDWQAQGTRVCGNAFFDNRQQDFFIEVCHGPCLVDNNLFLSKQSVAVFSEGMVFAHNLFAGEYMLRRDNRFTLYHIPHSTAIGGIQYIYGGDDRLINNIFIGKGNDPEKKCGTAMYDGYYDMSATEDKQQKEYPVGLSEKTLPVDIRDNVYMNGAENYCTEKCRKLDSIKPDINIRKENGQIYLDTDVMEYITGPDRKHITTDELGTFFEIDAPCENPDGTPVDIDRDFVGKKRNSTTYVGPFSYRCNAFILTKVQ